MVTRTSVTIGSGNELLHDVWVPMLRLVSLSLMANELNQISIDTIKLSLCMYILHTSTKIHHVFSKHVLSYIFYPSFIILCTDDIFVSLHISSTVYLRLWITYNVPRTQNIRLCFYPDTHLYVLHINRLWLQFVRWITVQSVTKSLTAW